MRRRDLAQTGSTDGTHVLAGKMDRAGIRAATRRSGQRATVDLPLPDCPASPRISPRWSEKETPSTAICDLAGTRRRPSSSERRSRNRLTSPSTARIGVAPERAHGARLLPACSGCAPSARTKGQAVN